MLEDKKKALESAIAQIEKQYGKGSIIKMDETNFGEGIEVIPTGCLPLDAALGVVELSKMQNETKDHRKHHGDHGHHYSNKFYAKLFQQVSLTSR